MNMRIRELRKVLNLNQVEFGERLGLSYSVIGLYENGKRSISDRVVNDICCVYRVNYRWLTLGKGNMFLISNPSLDNIYVEYNLNEVERKFLRSFLNLNKKERNYIATIIQLDK